MASYHFLMLLLALCALEVGARLFEQPSLAVETDSSSLSAENAKESVPYKVVETKYGYEIREYDEGRLPSPLHCHCTMDMSAAKVCHHKAG